MAGVRKMLPWLAGGLVVAGAVVALALPMYTCEWGRLEEFQAVGDPDVEIVCAQSDLGYRPSSWLPTKIAVATGGAVLAGAIVIASRKHALGGFALVVVFAAITIAWFVPSGFRQPVKNGEPACCGREVDRHPVRVWVIVSGAVLAAGLVTTDMLRTGRPSAETA